MSECDRFRKNYPSNNHMSSRRERTLIMSVVIATDLRPGPSANLVLVGGSAPGAGRFRQRGSRVAPADARLPRRARPRPWRPGLDRADAFPRRPLGWSGGARCPGRRARDRGRPDEPPRPAGGRSVARLRGHAVRRRPPAARRRPPRWSRGRAHAGPDPRPRRVLARGGARGDHRRPAAARRRRVGPVRRPVGGGSAGRHDRLRRADRRARPGHDDPRPRPARDRRPRRRRRQPRALRALPRGARPARSGTRSGGRSSRI